jgi:lysozyme
VSKQRVAVALLTVSLAGFGVWTANEGWSDTPIIPTKGDVPTIGHGSTHYEDGTPVKLTDPPITRERGALLARALMTKDEKAVIKSLPGVKLHQEEFEVYVDFVGQYGIGNWLKSTSRKNVLAGRYAQGCKALLKFKYAAGYDCSTPGNRRCSGVWTRQLERHRKCLEAQ